MASESRTTPPTPAGRCDGGPSLFFAAALVERTAVDRTTVALTAPSAPVPRYPGKTLHATASLVFGHVPIARGGVEHPDTPVPKA